MFTKQIITRFVFTILILAGLLFSSLGIASVRAASITVNTDADETTTNGLCSLREAIINANNDAATYPDCTAGLGADTISFAESYTITLAGAELPLVRSEIIIKGNGAANTIVQANASPNAAQYRVISVGTFFASLTLDGLTVRNGRCTGVGCDGYGGAIYNRGDLGILNSTVSGNTATIAGAIYNAEGATLDITNSILSGNTAWLVGGAIYSDVVSRTVITNSAISVNKTTGNNNSSIYYGSGGGIFSYQGSVIVLGSVFFGNSAAVNGGAIYGVDAQVAISDSTLSGNYSDSGAAIYKDGGSLTIGNSTLSNNTVSFHGGGISNQSGAMNITNSILSGNIASLGNGGGIYNGSEAVLSLYNSTVSRNGAGKGGAIYVIEGSLTIGSSILSNNSAFINGGGIANESGTVNMTNSILSGNSAKENGAGIFSKSGSLTVTGSTITGNISDESGGGIYNTGAANNLGIYNSTLSRNSAATGGGIYNNINGKLWLGNTTVSGNEAYDYGGGIYSDGSAWIHNSTIVFNVLVEGTDLGAAGVDGDVAFYNSIVAGNTRLPTSEYRDCSGSSLLFGMNLFSNITNCAFIENPDLWGYLNSLSALGSLQDNGGPAQTHALLPGSNAIDAGDNTLCAGWPINNLDQRGVTRPQGSQCDIGAYEYETVPPTSTPTITATPTSTFTPTNTFTPTDTSMPTNTFTPTLSISLTPTATPTNTFTPTPFISLTPTATPTNTFTPTPFNTLTPTSEHQYHFTPTPFNTRTPTSEHQHQFTPTPFNAPETRFIAMHVSKTNESSIYIFSFDSSGNNAYMCRMDQEAFSPCKNEITYSGLSAGSHTFQVYAIDPSGNPDPTPAEYSFMVTP